MRKELVPVIDTKEVPLAEVAATRKLILLNKFMMMRKNLCLDQTKTDYV